MLRFTTMFKRTAALTMGLCCLGASAAVNFIADPDPETMVSELSSVTLTIPDARALDYGSQYQNVTVTSEGFSRKCTLEYGEEDNQMIISFAKITEEGTYTINVPEDAIVDYGTPVEAFTITYKIGVDRYKNATLIPAPGEVEWIYDIVFNDPDLTVNLSYDSYSATKPTITSPSGEVSELNGVYDYTIGAGKYRFRLRRLAVEKGTYTINLPENCLYYQDESYNKVYLPAFEFKYDVAGGELTQVVSNPSMAEPTVNFNHLILEFPGYTTVAINSDLTYSEKTISYYLEGKEGAVSSFSLEEGADYFTIDGNKMNWKSNYTDCITPGHYFFTIPAGAILLGEEKTPNTPFTVDFEVVAPEPVAIDVTPADGSTVSMLNKAVITFPEIAKVDLGLSPRVTLSKITTEGEVESTISIGGAYSQTSFERLSDNSFLARFNGLATSDGDYRITIRPNSFIYDGGYNQEYASNVKFVASEAPVFTMSPDNTESLPKLQNFTIIFPKESVVTLNTLLSNKTVTLYEGEEIIRNEYGYISNAIIGTASDYTDVEGSSNSFSFKLNIAALNAGKYLLTIPAGVFLMGEEADNFSSEISVIYECNGEGLDKIKTTPSAPVKELKEMSVEFVNETSVSFASNWAGTTLYKYVEGQSYGTYLEYLSAGSNLKIEGNTLFITLNNVITEEGSYYIEINQYLLLMSDGVTQATPQKVFFTVDPDATTVSVEAIESEQTANRIFTITGLEVKDMKAPGIYIVNGNKVIVR